MKTAVKSTYLNQHADSLKTALINVHVTKMIQKRLNTLRTKGRELAVRDTQTLTKQELANTKAIQEAVDNQVEQWFKQLVKDRGLDSPFTADDVASLWVKFADETKRILQEIAL